MTFINNMRKLINDIKKYLKELSKKLGFKKRKTSIYDAFIFKLLYTMNDSCQELVATKINLFNNNDASRIAYLKRINNIDVSVFEKFNDFFNKRVDYYFHNDNKDYTIYADGTYTQLKEALNKDCKRVKNNNSVTCLSTGIFNVTYNEPTILKFENNETSEKESFKNIFENLKMSNEKQIFVFDRGYVNYFLFNEININNKYFISRVKKNTKYLNISKEDQIIQINDTCKFRYIKYIINDNEYLLCTNLFDFDIEILKMIYHKRWSIEEYFKLIKKTTNINKNNEALINNIKKSFVFYNIVSKLVYLIKNNFEKQINNSKNKTIKKINLSHLVNTLYNSDFYIKFFYGRHNEKSLNNIFKLAIKFLYFVEEISNLRVCKRSNYLSYYKSYSINNKKLCK